MQMQTRITEFFEYIFESFKEDIPEFLVVAHEFKVRHALRGNVDAGTVALMVKENAYGQRIIALEQNFYKVSGIISNTSESLQPAMLRVLGGSVTQMLADLQVPAEAAAGIMGVLDDILNDYKDITPEQLQAAQKLLAQILNQIAATEAAQQPDPQAGETTAVSPEENNGSTTEEDTEETSEESTEESTEEAAADQGSGV